MTVKTKKRKGLQSRGKTEIDADFTIQKSGTEITVTEGTFISTDGTEYNVTRTSKDIGVSKKSRIIGIWLVDYGNGPEIEISEDRPQPKYIIQTFVYRDWFKIPPNTSDLSKVDMYAFGWIDEHPASVEYNLPEGVNELVHDDIQKLKKKGNELEAEDAPEMKIQKPEEKTNTDKVRSSK